MLLPKIKLKTVPTFPSNIIGGTGLTTAKQNGAVTLDFAWQEFGTISAIPTSPTSNILTYDTATGAYVMVPSQLLGGAASGISEAPIDGNQYGRQGATWALQTVSTHAALVGAFINSTPVFIQTTGYYAVGDGGGALYKRVGSAPSHAGKVQSADGAWWELCELEPNVLMFGAKADWNGSSGTDNALAFNSAINYAAAVKRGTIYVPKGSYAVADVIIIDSPNVCISSYSRKSGGVHNYGRDTMADCDAIIVWTGVSNGWVFRFEPANAATMAQVQRLNGVGMYGIAIDGRNIAGVGIICFSVNGSRFENLFLQNFKTATITLSVYPAINGGVQIGDPPDTQHNLFQNIAMNQISAAGTCITCDGYFNSTWPNTGANVSLNRFVDITGFQSPTNNGAILYGTDNNVWDNVGWFNTGPYMGFDLRPGSTASLGSYATNSEHFYNFTGSMALRGTDSYPGLPPTHNITVYSIDKGNGSADPVMETGCTAAWTTTDRKMVGWEIVQSQVAYTPTVSSSGGAVTIAARSGSYIRNGKHIRFTALVNITGGSGTLRVGTPSTPAVAPFILRGVDLGSGTLLVALTISGNAFASMTTLAGAYPTTGNYIQVEGEYDEP